MINKSELMVGNTVICNEDGVICHILEVCEYGVGVNPDGDPIYMEFDCFDYLPLKDAVLDQMGFSFENSGYPKGHEDYHDWYEKEFPVIGTLCQSSDKTYLFDENTDTLRIKYVHELQNLIKILSIKTNI